MTGLLDLQYQLEITQSWVKLKAELSIWSTELSFYHALAFSICSVNLKSGTSITPKLHFIVISYLPIKYFPIMKTLFGAAALFLALTGDVYAKTKPNAKSSKSGTCLLSDVAPLEDKPAILLSTAQNALVYEYFKEHYFNAVLPPLGPQQAVAYPHESDGAEELKVLVAEMLTSSFGAFFDPENLYGTVGVLAALETFFRVLQSNVGRGNDVITATPFWPGFRYASELLKDATLIPFAPADQTSFQITVDDIIAALDNNPSVRFLIICNPHNPLGVIYKKEHLEAIYTYILQERPDIHIVSDEIYAHSILPGHKSKFVSAMALDAYQSATAEQKERVHLMWGYSKDFGLNGFKVGWIYSTNIQLQSAMNPVVVAPISSLTNYYLIGLMQAKAPGIDAALYETGMDHYAEKLAISHELVKSKLIQMGINFFDQNYGAQFFWLDLSQAATSVGSEETLTALFRDAGVVLGSGSWFNSDTPGYMRLCYTCYEPDIVLEGLDIIGDILFTLESEDEHQELLDSLNVTSAQDITNSYPIL